MMKLPLDRDRLNQTLQILTSFRVKTDEALGWNLYRQSLNDALVDRALENVDIDTQNRYENTWWSDVQVSNEDIVVTIYSGAEADA